jgi:hypothetical protein
MGPAAEAVAEAAVEAAAGVLLTDGAAAEALAEAAVEAAAVYYSQTGQQLKQ